MERSKEIEDSSLSCWGGTRVAGSLRGSSLIKKKMNLVGPWFHEEGTESGTLRGLFLYSSNQCFEGC